MGGVAKALLRRGDETFLEKIRAALADIAVPFSDVVVVVGPPFGAVVAAHARELGAPVVENPDPSRGMSSSINLGFASLVASAAEAAWLWPVDHPDVSVATLRALVAKLGDHEVARPVCAGRGGHPPLVRRALFEKLAQCTNARDVIAGADVVNVPVDDRGTIEDVDH
jgi:molybdenum cofactor cytidylyltransferase